MLKPIAEWSLARKIAAGYALPLVLLLAIGCTAYVNVQELRQANEWMAHTNEVLRAIDGLVAAMVDAETGERGFVITTEQRYLEPYHAAVARVGTLQDRVRTLTADNPDQQRRLDALQPVIAARLDELQNVIAITQRAGQIAGELAVTQGHGKESMDRIRGLAGEMEETETALLQQRTRDADLATTRALWIIVGATLLALALATLVGVGIIRWIRRQIEQSVSAIAASSAETLAATTQQAAGTTQQAAAVQQASSTVEEVKHTAVASAERARTVAESAIRTAQVSQEGERAVVATVQSMREAKARMETIAGRVLTLSERGLAIGEIIATVNGVAEQSNLLAVNAAIEAAKAGEAGRGFAVVASEVKSLAEQSKQATAQVREILGEIQQATQAAVMAAEQGVKAAESGEQVAEQAGEAIRLLRGQLDQSAQTAQQILVSVQEQVVGMDQIALAMEQIQQASTQHMVATRQLERSATDLNDVAGQLSLLVAAGEGHRNGQQNGRHPYPNGYSNGQHAS